LLLPVIAITGHSTGYGYYYWPFLSPVIANTGYGYYWSFLLPVNAITGHFTGYSYYW
jgi:hypothetical protein